LLPERLPPRPKPLSLRKFEKENNWTKEHGEWKIENEKLKGEIQN